MFRHVSVKTVCFPNSIDMQVLGQGLVCQWLTKGQNQISELLSIMPNFENPLMMFLGVTVSNQNLDTIVGMS